VGNKTLLVEFLIEGGDDNRMNKSYQELYESAVSIAESIGLQTETNVTITIGPVLEKPSDGLSAVGLVPDQDHSRRWITSDNITTWQVMIHQWAVSKEFWKEYRPGRKVFEDSHLMLGLLMKVVTELGEAGEEVRLGNFEKMAEELADTVIRVFDITEALGIDIATEMVKKMEKNETRPIKHGKRV
jgi:NTP pyrophosphatase (non-canonical NTP hydrolase)